MLWLRGAALLLVLLAVGCRDRAPEPYSDLGTLGELQTRFNRDAGKTRVVLLLSPT